jgi:hypothetical protein
MSAQHETATEARLSGDHGADQERNVIGVAMHVMDGPVVRLLSDGGVAANMECVVCHYPLIKEADSLRLVCGDAVHYHCLLPYIRSLCGILTGSQYTSSRVPIIIKITG